MAAVAAVGSGTAAATTASTVAAGAFIGSATAFGIAAATAAAGSSTEKEFADQGDWGTVASTVGGAVAGSVGGYAIAKSPSVNSSTTKTSKLDKYVKNPENLKMYNLQK